MARVSILMSVHGTGAWLPEALASIPWEMQPEVIITANGRNDWLHVVEAEREFGCANTFYYEDTLTLSDSLNAMLALAYGDYVMRLDPDDKLPKGALQAMLATAEAAPQPCVVYGGYIEFGERVRRIEAGRPTLAAMRLHPPGAYNVLVNTSLARQIGGWIEEGYEDWHYQARLLLSGAPWVDAGVPTLLYRVRPDGRYAEFVRTNDARVAVIRRLLEVTP